MKIDRAAWLLFVVLAFALAGYSVDSGLASERPSADGCEAAAIAQQSCQGLSSTPAACAEKAGALVSPGCVDACVAKCTKPSGAACAGAAGAPCGETCKGVCNIECAQMCGAGCRCSGATVCGPRWRSAHAARDCDCGKVSCRLYGIGCGHGRHSGGAQRCASMPCQKPCCAAPCKEMKQVRVSKCKPGCQKPCCAAPCKEVKQVRASKCKPGCQKPCCATPCKEMKQVRVSKCKPGCQKPCCAAPCKEMKQVRASKCKPGCQKPCCAAPSKEMKQVRVSKCKPGCQKPCCAATEGSPTHVWIEELGEHGMLKGEYKIAGLDCGMEGGEGEKVYVLRTNPGDEHVWIEAAGDARGKDRDRKVRKIRIKKPHAEVKEIVVNDDGLWCGDLDAEDIYVMKSGGGEIAWLGVQLQDLTPELREAFDIPAVVQGVLIADVDRSGPARKSGIRKGFVVVEFDGTPIHSADDLIEAVRASDPGDRVAVVMNRKGATITRRVTLGSRPAEVEMPGEFEIEIPDFEFEMPEIDEMVEVKRLTASRGAFLGVSAETPTEEQRQKLGAPQDAGVVISEVNEASAADEAGLEKGDVIVKIDDDAIRDTDDLIEAITSRKPGDVVTLFLLRDGQRMKVDAELGERQMPESLRLIAPRAMKLKNESRLEMRRKTLEAQMMRLKERLKSLRDELDELDEELREAEEED